MIHLLILAVHLLATIAKLVRPGGIRAVVAESLLLKHQLLISSRACAGHQSEFGRSPPPGSWIAVCVTKPNPQARGRSEAQNLVQIPCGAQEMQISVALLVGRSSAPRPEGTVEGTHRGDRRVQTPQPPRWLSPHCTGDCARLWHRYQQRHRPPGAGETLSTGGRNRWPSWPSFIGHVKDSLWSVDLFRCESILLRSHWVMVVMDVFTRRIIGFGVERAVPALSPPIVV